MFRPFQPLRWGVDTAVRVCVLGALGVRAACRVRPGLGQAVSLCRAAYS